MVRKGYSKTEPREGGTIPAPYAPEGPSPFSRWRNPSRVLRKKEEIWRLVIYGSSHRTVSAADPFCSSITSTGTF